MNRINHIIYILFISILCSNCYDTKNQNGTNVNSLQAPIFPNTSFDSKIIPIDTSKSKITWKGTKMMGIGKHEGDIKLIEGEFLVSKEKLIGGHFLVDMNTINVTDIPEHEPVPRRNLINHLKSQDFFDVSKFPNAKFEITEVDYSKSIPSLIGNLTIKDVRKQIEIKADLAMDNKNITLLSSFEIDRFNWNVGYTGSWADKTLVDKEVKITVDLKSK